MSNSPMKSFNLVCIPLWPTYPSPCWCNYSSLGRLWVILRCGIYLRWMRKSDDLRKRNETNADLLGCPSTKKIDQEMATFTGKQVFQSSIIWERWYILQARYALSFKAAPVIREKKLRTTLHWSQIGPESNPCIETSSIWSIETPVVVSPFSMVRCIGAAPRYLGKSDGWTLRRSSGRKWLRTDTGIALPNEAVIIALGPCVSRMEFGS